MEKNTYQNMMQHIKMSDSCEAEILRRAEEMDAASPQIAVHTKKKRNRIPVIAAACVGVVFIGTVTVSAMQNTGWLAGFFPHIEDAPDDTAQAIAEQFVSEMEDFTAEGENAEFFQPVGAMCDGRNLYFAVQYGMTEDDIAMSVCRQADIICDGRAVAYAGSASSVLENEDGTKVLYHRIAFDRVITGNELDVALGYSISGNEGNDYTLHFSVNAADKARRITYYVDDVLKREIQPLGVNAYFAVDSIEVSAFSVTLHGTGSDAHPYSISYNALSVITADGTEHVCDRNTQETLHADGMSTSKIEIFYNMPIEPETVTAVKIGDKEIALT